MNSYFWLALLLSLLGPIFYHWLSSRSEISRFFDGMSTVVLLGLVTLHILPESFKHSGLITMVSVAVGLLGPVLLSNLTKRKQCEIQKPFLIMSILGLIAHNMLDGAALVVHPNGQSIHMLALAVAIHRFLESIAIFKTISKSLGLWLSALAIVGLSLAMALGFFFGEQLFTRMDDGFLHILQSLACGMIFHVVLHPHHVKEIWIEARTGKLLFKQSAGAFCGLLIVALAYIFSPSYYTHEKEADRHAHTEGE